MAKGIDIYRYQTVDNWQQLKNSDVTFIYVKHTDGGGPASVHADNQVNGAKRVGIPVGGYHYAQLTPSPEDQADILINEIERLGSKDLVPMLDIETPFVPNEAAKNFGIRFCRRIAARGYRPGVYTSDSFASVIRPDTWDTNPVLWIARYGSKPKTTGYDIHQYADNGSVPGISGLVDLNESYTDDHFVKTKVNTQTGKEKDMALNTESFQPTYNKEAGEEPKFRRHTYVAPTNSKYGTIYQTSWLTIKCAWGSIEEVWVECVDSAGKGLFGQWFRDIPQNKNLVNIQAPDGTDQYSVQIVSNAEYSICIEGKIR